MARELYLVTGANKGIGFAITKGLLQMGHQVILGCRSEERATEAMHKLADLLKKDVPTAKDQMEFIPVDLEKPESFEEASKMFQTLMNGRKLNALINNAGFAFTQNATESVAVQAAKTVGINYTNTAHFTETFIPHVMDGGRIVFLGSRAGLLSGLKSKERQQKLHSEDLTLSELRKIVDEYLAATKEGTQVEKGFTDTTYGMSKIAINTYARLLAKDAEIVKRHIIVNACCPGYVNTDMTLGEGTKTPEEGADTPIWLATSQEEGAKVTGKFFGERKEISLLSTW